MGRGFQEKKHLHIRYIWFQGAARASGKCPSGQHRTGWRENGRDGDTDLGIIYIKKIPKTMKFHGLTTKNLLKKSEKQRIQLRKGTKVSCKMATEVKGGRTKACLQASEEDNKSNTTEIKYEH